MRHPQLLIPVVILLPVTALASQGLAAPSVLAPVLGVPADTGDSAAGRLVRPRAPLQCPMPVQRPEAGATVPIPTSRAQPSRSTFLPAGEVAAGLSSMPVARADCWNPLDRPQGARDSVVTDSVLPGH